MKQATRKPTTPGDILLYEYLEPLDLKINELAELLHVHRNSVSALINNPRIDLFQFNRLLFPLLQMRGRQRYLIRPLAKICLFLDYRYFFVEAHSLCCIDTPKVS